MGTSRGASIPSRTLSPRISTTVMTMESSTTMLSFFFRERTNISHNSEGHAPSSSMQYKFLWVFAQRWRQAFHHSDCRLYRCSVKSPIFKAIGTRPRLMPQFRDEQLTYIQ